LLDVGGAGRRLVARPTVLPRLAGPPVRRRPALAPPGDAHFGFPPALPVGAGPTSGWRRTAVRRQLLLHPVVRHALDPAVRGGTDRAVGRRGGVSVGLAGRR